jgi:hypothetical protein
MHSSISVLVGHVREPEDKSFRLFSYSGINMVLSPPVSRQPMGKDSKIGAPPLDLDPDSLQDAIPVEQRTEDDQGLARGA